MEPVAQTVWRLEFARKAAISRELEDRLRDEKARHDRREIELADDRRDNNEMAELLTAVLASAEQIEAFTVKLDRYDTATVDALMQNEQDLAVVRERIETMLLEAHTLPDGRRVFKTRDGERVFDEHGTEMKAEEIDPNVIADTKTRWEVYRDTRNAEKALVDERHQLLEFQQKIDDARERLEDPELTEKELKALEAELGEAAPDRVRKTLQRDQPKADKADPVNDTPSIADNEGRLTRQAGLSLGPSGP